MAMARKVTTHPSTERRRVTVITRFLALKKEHKVACNRMWAGTLAGNFTADDVQLIPDMFSEADRQLLSVMRTEGIGSLLFPLTQIRHEKVSE